MTMSATTAGVNTASAATAERPYDLDQTWVAIQEAASEDRGEELAEIAISLYAQLGVANAEISRLRASLHSSLRALSASSCRGVR
jgi:hypothetical protein